MKVICIASGSSGNCYVLSDSSGNCIILDAGLPFEKITSNPNFPKFSKIDFVFISHCHGDHNKSMKEFEQSGCEMLTYEMLEPKVQNWEYNNWSVITFSVQHNVPCWGIIIKSNIDNEKLCYVTDFCKMPKVEGVTHWLYEVNYIEAYIDQMIDENKELKHIGFNNHNSLENAVDYFSSLKTRPQMIICVHLSKYNSIEDKIKSEISKFADKLYVAHKGDIYED